MTKRFRSIRHYNQKRVGSLACAVAILLSRPVLQSPHGHRTEYFIFLCAEVSCVHIRVDFFGQKNELLNHLIEMKAQYNACSSTSTMPIFCISKDNCPWIFKRLSLRLSIWCRQEVSESHHQFSQLLCTEERLLAPKSLETDRHIIIETI